MRTILAPVDFSPATGSVVAAAVALATPGESTIVLLHVKQPPAVVTDYGLMGSYILPVVEEEDKTAEQKLENCRQDIAPHVRIVSTELLSGNLPSEVIAAEATRRGADYIVMGSHGHTGLYDLLIGSTTGGVLKRASCPVVIVPAPNEARKRRAH